MKKRNKTALAVLVSLLALALFSYRNVLNTWFVTSGSIAHAAEGVFELRQAVPYLHGPAMEGTTIAEGRQYYRPLAELSYGLNYLTTGMNVTAMRITNVALHAGIGTLLFLYAEKALKRTRKEAAAVALLFVIHPIGAQVVPAMSRRHDLLMSIFALGALLVHYKALESSRKDYHAFAGILALSSVLSKETGLITAPLMISQHLFLKNWDRIKDLRSFMEQGVRSTVSSTWALAVVPVYFSIRIYGLGGIGTTGSGDYGVLMTVRLLAGYVLSMVRPSALIHPVVPQAFKIEVLQGAMTPTVIGPVLLSITAAAAAIEWRKSDTNTGVREAVFLCTWMAGYGAMLLLSGSSALRYGYFPTLAALALGAIVFRRFRSADTSYGKFGMVLIVFLAASTFSFNPAAYDFKEYRNAGDINRQTMAQAEQVETYTNETYMSNTVSSIEYENRRITNLYYTQAQSIEAWVQMNRRKDIKIHGSDRVTLEDPPSKVILEEEGNDPLRITFKYR